MSRAGLSVTARDTLLTDGDAGNAWTLSLTFGEPMDPEYLPTITMTPDASGTLLAARPGTWSQELRGLHGGLHGGRSRPAGPGVSVTVEGARDLAGNLQDPSTATDVFRVVMDTPAVVYVDDDWAGTSREATPVGSDPAGLTFGYNAFATLQAAIDRVAANGSVILYGGMLCGSGRGDQGTGTHPDHGELVHSRPEPSTSRAGDGGVAQPVTFASENGHVALLPADGWPSSFSVRASGTAGDDTFAFASGLAAHTVTLNVNRIAVDADIVEAIYLLGGEGNDAAMSPARRVTIGQR